MRYPYRCTCGKEFEVIKHSKNIDDIEICPECGHNCTDYRMVRVPPKHERTATRKARIGTARRRSIANRKDLFDTDKWKVPGTKKH